MAMIGGVEVKGGNIFHRRGDTGKLAVNLMVGDAPYVFQSGDTGLFTVKKRIGDDEIVFQKEMADGAFLLEPADTKDLVPGSYRYDMQVTLSSGEVYTVAMGKYKLLPDITTRKEEEDEEVEQQ
jgi:hypothetical protein